MRILYHHRTQAEDGQAVHIRSLIRALESLGHEVEEVGLVRQAATEAAPEKRGTGRSRWGWVTRLPRFARELAEYGYSSLARQRILRQALLFGPDVLYERYAFGNAAGVLAARKLRLPLFLEVNSPLVLEMQRTRGLSFPGLAKRVEDYVYRSADRVCTVTGVLRDMLVEMGVQRERILVTPNGVDLELYEYEDRSAVRRAARADLGLPPEDEDGEGVVLGFVGYYRTWHRLDVALRCLATPELERARLVLIGEGPAREELEALARERGVAARVRFAGPRPHGRIPSLLPAFDVALIPAINSYASPLKLHEYMAASLPVIAPEQDNLRETLVDGENAILVPSGDADRLGAAICELVGDEERRAEMGRRARQTVLDRDLTWPGNARRVVRAAEELSR